MHTLKRLLCATCMAVTTLAALASAAGASGALIIEPAEQFTATEGTVTFQEREGGLRVTCSMTVGGSFAGGIEKTAARSLEGGPLAEVRSGSTSRCTESFGSDEVVFLVETARPFLARYDSFLGTLPTITGILLTVLEVKLQVTTSFLRLRCLYEGSVGILIPIERGSATRFSFLESTARLISGGEACPREGRLRGTMRLNRAQTVTLGAEREERAPILRATPDPIVMEEAMERIFLMMKNISNRPVFVRRALPFQRRGTMEAAIEAGCNRWLMRNEECAAIVRKVEVPAEGDMVIEYRVGMALAFERRVRYDAR